jgi:glycosyltransferase involved in cell wall biosynthesis
VHAVEELVALGYDVTINAFNRDSLDISKFSPVIQKCLNNTIDENSLNITFAYPDTIPKTRNFKVNVCYSGFDTLGGYHTKGNPMPSQILNEYADYFITPSYYSKKIAENLGVKIPIDVVPHGINPDLFKPIQREFSYPFTFAYCGELTERKGIYETLEAFIQLYGNNPDYKLLLRANTDMLYLQDEYKRVMELVDSVDNIDIVYQNAGQENMVNYYNRAHAYICPTKADSFNMTVMEAMALGIPTIATATNGYYDFFRNIIMPLKYYPEDVGDRHPYFLGQWNCVDVNHLMKFMSYITTPQYYNEEAEKFYAFAEEMQTEWSWENIIKKYLVPFIEKVKSEKFASKKIKFKIPKILKVLIS